MTAVGGGEDRAPSTVKLVAAVVAHVGTASVAPGALEGWNMLDAVYFAVTCASTVGYGDIVVTRDISKLFVAVYSLLSCLLIGGVFASVVDRLVERQHAMAQRLRTRMVAARLADESCGGGGGKSSAAGGGAHGLVRAASAAAAGARSRFAASAVLLLVVCLTGGALYGRLQRLTVVDTIHLVSATLTTVGFGDFSPQTKTGRAFAVVWLVLSSIGLANLLGRWNELQLREREVGMSKQLMSSQMTEETYRAIDKDGDGRLDQMEYVTYVLSKLGKTTPAEVDSIRDRFRQLDADGSGFITRDELEVE
jgi:potassium channel subfamily K, other eukaryote